MTTNQKVILQDAIECAKMLQGGKWDTNLPYDKIVARLIDDIETVLRIDAS